MAARMLLLVSFMLLVAAVATGLGWWVAAWRAGNLTQPLPSGMGVMLVVLAVGQVAAFTGAGLALCSPSVRQSLARVAIMPLCMLGLLLGNLVSFLTPALGLPLALAMSVCALVVARVDLGRHAA